MAQLVAFERAYWGRQAFGIRASIVAVDGSVALITPAPVAMPAAPADKATEAIRSMLAPLAARYREAALPQAEPLWTRPYRDVFTGEMVMSNFTPSRDSGGKLVGFVAATISARQLLGDVITTSGSPLVSDQAVAFFDESGRLLYRGDALSRLDVDSMRAQLERRVSADQLKTAYWFEQETC
ncbi:PDC sensor domain-containing protein [Cupriavidus basilensis]